MRLLVAVVIQTTLVAHQVTRTIQIAVNPMILVMAEQAAKVVGTVAVTIPVTTAPVRDMTLIPALGEGHTVKATTTVVEELPVLAVSVAVAAASVAMSATILLALAIHIVDATTTRPLVTVAVVRAAPMPVTLHAATTKEIALLGAAVQTPATLAAPTTIRPPAAAAVTAEGVAAALMARTTAMEVAATEAITVSWNKSLLWVVWSLPAYSRYLA